MYTVRYLIHVHIIFIVIMIMAVVIVNSKEERTPLFNECKKPTSRSRRLSFLALFQRIPTGRRFRFRMAIKGFGIGSLERGVM